MCGRSHIRNKINKINVTGTMYFIQHLFSPCDLIRLSGSLYLSEVMFVGQSLPTQDDNDNNNTPLTKSESETGEPITAPAEVTEKRTWIGNCK